MKRAEARLIAKSADGATEYLSDGQFIYAKKGGETFKLALFDNGFYKLRLFNGVPILEIDGIRMHLVKEFRTPLDYAKEVVREAGITARDRVLDTCMGLGYTAIEASLSAKSVATCEISRAVLTLAEWNPWSRALFNNKKIEIMEGDVAQMVRGMSSSSFDVVLHDPPRFSMAGGLYSLEFYKELHRVLGKGGRLFHYVGSVGIKKGRNIADEVSTRLANAGFKNIRHKQKLQGFIAEK